MINLKTIKRVGNGNKPMKAITVKQPYAYLICSGIDNIENRTYPCPNDYIGSRVLIHASSVSVEMINPNSIFSKAQWEALSLEQDHPSIWAEKAQYNWVLVNPILFEHPIEKVSGRPNLWKMQGICQYCGCTENHACYSERLGSCWWADEDQSICSHCATE